MGNYSSLSITVITCFNIACLLSDLDRILGLSSSPSNFNVTPCNRICRYNNNFFNGKVCIGCFRETIEISSWSQMTNLEKGFALEDAADRCDESCIGTIQEGDIRFDGGVDSNELRKQAQAWFELSNRSNNEDNRSLNENEKNEETTYSNSSKIKSADIRGSDYNPSIIIESISNHDQETNTYDVIFNPCKGICRFDSRFFDGQVCQKCYRDKYEVMDWGKFTHEQKIIALLDIDNRKREVQFVLDETKQQDAKWEEIDISKKQKIRQNDIMSFDKFLEGNSIIMLHSIMDDVDCDIIVENASKHAKKYRSERDSLGLPDEGVVRLPTIDAASRAKKNNTPCANPIDPKSDSILKDVLQQTLQIIDEELPHLVSSIFGIKSISFQYQKENGLVYSSREPAINVYTKGGQFIAHEDGHQLTILIPLSSPHEFSGGGTAFWCQESKGHRVDSPSLILKPPRGTAMLFGGHITHAGLPIIEWGERVVFVASFSMNRNL